MRRRPSRGPSLTALAAALGVVCLLHPLAAAQQAPVAPAPANAAVAALQHALATLIADPLVDHAQWTMRVDSLATGESLFDYRGRQLMVPGSNQKLLTAAVAADRLGWDYRFTTRLLTTGAIDAQGTLVGDVYVVGDGDPSINPRHPERWGAFDAWAAKLHDMGLRIVDGRLIGDDNLIDEPGWGSGWAWDDLQWGYGAPAAALQYNEGQVELTVGPGLEAGAPAVITTSPAGSGLLIDGKAMTTARGSETAIGVSRWPGTVFVSVTGAVAAGSPPRTMLAAVDNPTTFYVTALRDALARHDIFVGGGPVDIDGLPHAEAPPPAALHELLVDRSPPLSELIDVMLKWSRNDYAETLLTALSPLAEVPGMPAGPEPPPSARSAARGLTVLEKTLDGWGIPAPGFRSRDGSGLSRMDYVSANSLVLLLTHMWNDPAHREPFRATLPQAAVSGTLAGRLTGTPAAGRVWAKTGTLSNVRTLSGYAETRDGEPLVFSILVNNFVVPPAEVDAIVDKMLLELVALPRRR